MLEWITLGLVIAKYVLDYVAPRTKTKVDDKFRDVADQLPLPSLPKAVEDATRKAPATQGGVTVRDHR